jgi:hypothetical protein
MTKEYFLNNPGGITVGAILWPRGRPMGGGDAIDVKEVLTYVVLLHCRRG